MFVGFLEKMQIIVVDKTVVKHAVLQIFGLHFHIFRHGLAFSLYGEK